MLNVNINVKKFLTVAIQEKEVKNISFKLGLQRMTWVFLLILKIYFEIKCLIRAKYNLYISPGAF